ncbi:MAG: hypothetical protein ACFFCQ_08235 [Promethearchaeota archaeon]
MEAKAAQIEREFHSCERCLLLARDIVNRKWLPAFLRPDLTPLEVTFNTVKHGYEHFQKARLIRLGDKY